MKRVLCIWLAALLLCACAAAEVIGGADGPTMVFVASGEEQSGDESMPEIVNIIGEIESVEVSVGGAEAMPAAPDAEPAGGLRLSGVSIGVDPGHQAHANSAKEPVAPGSSEKKAKVASGTQGVSTGIPEYVTNLEVSLKLRDALTALGATVYMTRETHDVDISNMERAIMFNELNVDLALRIHCNGAENRSVNGAGTYARKTGEKQEESERAATLILDALCAATGARRDGVFLRDTYTGQNWSTVPCVMVEMGFMSNPEEDVKLNDPDYQDLLVAGMVEGICQYFER